MAIITHPTRIFDLHCDTLDRLALRSAIPEAGFMAEDALHSRTSYGLAG